MDEEEFNHILNQWWGQSSTSPGYFSYSFTIKETLDIPVRKDNNREDLGEITTDEIIRFYNNLQKRGIRGIKQGKQ